MVAVQCAVMQMKNNRLRFTYVFAGLEEGILDMWQLCAAVTKRQIRC